MHQNKGLSVAELAIVIVVIALLAAIVSSGINIKRLSVLQGFVTDIQRFQVAIEQFDLQLDNLPGDMDDAHDNWGALCDENAASCDGNGDGEIAFSENTNIGGDDEDSEKDESYRTWQHLALGGYIEERYTGSSQDGQADIGINVPASKRSTVGYVMRWNEDNTRNEIQIGAFSADAPATNPALTPTEAEGIDLQLDDGVPNAGTIRAMGANCFADGDYSLEQGNTRTCRLAFPLLP